jgi:DNA-binding transcriptional MerR regulator
MGQVTNEQVNLMLRLYEDRREQRLREAREWYAANFHVKNQEEMMRLCPPGSQANTYMRMVLGYWEMLASIVNRGLIDEDLFFENSGEQWAVWEQMKPVIGEVRAMFKSPKVFANLEEHVRRLEAWREKHNPGSNEAIRSVLAQMQQVRQAAKAQAAGS